MGDLLQTVVEGSVDPLEPVETHVPESGHGAPGSVMTPDSLTTSGSVTTQAIPPIVIGQDLAETIGAEVGDTVLVTRPQGELTPLGLVPKYAAVSGGGDIQVGVLSVRLELCVYAAGGCAAAVQRAGSDLGDQLQGG